MLKKLQWAAPALTRHQPGILSFSSFLKKRGIPYYELHDPLLALVKEKRLKLYLPADGHLSALGNELVAGYMAGEVLEKQ